MYKRARADEDDDNDEENGRDQARKNIPNSTSDIKTKALHKRNHDRKSVQTEI